jgi:hypothetical protein
MVNVSHLQMSNEVAAGHGNLGGYELYDCVSLNENEVAVVIQVNIYLYSLCIYVLY